MCVMLWRAVLQLVKLSCNAAVMNVLYTRSNGVGNRSQLACQQAHSSRTIHDMHFNDNADHFNDNADQASAYNPT